MGTCRTAILAAAALCAFVVLPAARSARPALAAPKAPAPNRTPATGLAAMKPFQTNCYVIYARPDVGDIRGICLRMNALSDEYYRRTRDFGGAIRSKLPFYLFSDRGDYLAAGGVPGSAGVFDGKSLMAVIGEKLDERDWRVIQHEAFHQFAAAFMGRLPSWLNEGLAEYFAEALYTGDGFVTGIIPSGRLARLRRDIRQDKLTSFGDFMTISHKQWSADLRTANYDQAWAMVQFLIHGDGGRYIQPLGRLVSLLDSGMRYEQAWLRSFGRDIPGFERRWRQFWLELPAEPGVELYAQATAATLTSFLARAACQKQGFTDAADFLRQARQGTLKCGQNDWLPPGLLKAALGKSAKAGQWELLTGQSKQPQLACTLTDGTKLVGSFAVVNGQPRDVKVRIERPATSQPASRASTATQPAR